MVNATLLNSFKEALQEDSEGAANTTNQPPAKSSQNRSKRRGPRGKRDSGERDPDAEQSGSSDSTQEQNNNATRTERPKKMPRRKKKQEPEITEEELELRAKMKKLQNKSGVWEVSMNNGIVLGLYSGKPSKIGAYVCAQQTKAPKSLYFQLVKIKEAPEVISKDRCCERKFQRRDNFCPLCGGPRNLDSSIPDDVQVEVYTDVG